MPCDSVCQTIEDFYPRPPRGGRRCQPRPGSRPDQFLSTPSARRATATPGGDYSGVHISIHALREEGDSFADGAHLLHGISIHALREEGDISSRPLMIPNNKFLSTPSARRATIRKGVIP